MAGEGKGGERFPLLFYNLTTGCMSLTCFVYMLKIFGNRIENGRNVQTEYASILFHIDLILDVN